MTNLFQEEIGFVCNSSSLAVLFTKEPIINELMNHSQSQSQQSDSGDVFVYFLQPLEDKIDLAKLTKVLDNYTSDVFYFARTATGDILQSGEYQSDIDFGIVEQNFIFPNI